ncbi:MAG: hypothetical protein QGI57_03230 [Dehalococcoidales bacterium]|jgi:NAD(P)-dependent dehydrogenase (short-subunit alcohol dehydrogenase family)|nr:hypothetical protein [Dehalococcoidales bacterium]
MSDPMAFHANVLKEAEVTGMVDRMVAEWGGIDVLVNNVCVGGATMLGCWKTCQSPNGTGRWTSI